MNERKTVILDTDIGGDIDDTWALAMLLNSPELDTKMVVSATADTVYRAEIVAKILERNGRSDIDVGIGVRGESDGPRERQKRWVADYRLEQYPGKIHHDGVDAMIELIEASPGPVWLIAIGPVTNLAELVRRSPGSAGKVHLVAMLGSIDKTHEGKPGAIAEFNVVKDIAAAQTVWAAGWKSITITPLDTCGLVILRDQLYKQAFESENSLLRDVIENYQIWSGDGLPWDPTKRSSILYDTVAVHLACSTRFLEMENMRLTIDDQGFTRRDPNGVPVSVAMRWSDMDGYNRYLVQRLTGK